MGDHKDPRAGSVVCALYLIDPEGEPDYVASGLNAADCVARLRALLIRDGVIEGEIV